MRHITILALSGTPALVISQGQRSFKRGLIIATVVDDASHRCMRESLRWDKITATHLRGIKRQLMGNAIHGAFQDIRSFWPSGTSVGGSGGFVRENPHHPAFYRLHLVWSTQHRRHAARNHCCSER